LEIIQHLKQKNSIKKDYVKSFIMLMDHASIILWLAGMDYWKVIINVKNAFIYVAVNLQRSIINAVGANVADHLQQITELIGQLAENLNLKTQTYDSKNH